MNKILFPLLVVWPGIIVGAMVGGWITHSLFGTGGHMDMSGLSGAFLGMPLGGGLSAYIALAAGRWVDRRVGSQLTPAKIKRLSIAAGSCAALGFLASLKSGATELPTFLGGLDRIHDRLRVVRRVGLEKQNRSAELPPNSAP